MKFDDDEIRTMKTLLREFINDYCIIRRPTGDKDFLLQDMHGGNYNWQFYPRRGLFNSKFLSYVGMIFWSKYADKFRESPFQLAGLETGSTPLLVGLAMTAPSFEIRVNAFSIRKDRKTYGQYNRMEGIVNDDPVLLVDDLCNSKNTMFLARKHCIEEGLTIYDTAFTIINKNILPTDSARFDKHIGAQLPVDSIFYISDFDTDYETYTYNKLHNISSY